MANEWLTPYTMDKVLAGVLPALPKIRPNFLQSVLASGYTTSERPSVNFDKEYAIKNTSAMFVHHRADVTPIQLGDFGTTEMYFAYSKEGWSEDEFDVINQRQLGQAFGTVNPLANQAARIAQKATIAEQRFENLFEKTWASIALYGGYEAYSQKFPRMRYDFGRSVVSTYAGLSADTIASVNLTTTAVTAPWDSSVTILPVVATSGGFTAGDKAWTKALVTAAKATPVLDLTKQYNTSRRNLATTKYFIMQSDAYEAFNFDVITNYKDAALNTVSTMVSTSLDVTPRLKEIDGLTYQRSWDFGGGNVVPIYSYEAKINNRDTGTEEAFIPQGWVLGIPDTSYGIKVYGRVLHPKANYAAMPRWINRWSDEKDAVMMYEEHCSFLLGHTRINALTAWKVC